MPFLKDMCLVFFFTFVHDRRLGLTSLHVQGGVCSGPASRSGFCDSKMIILAVDAVL